MSDLGPLDPFSQTGEDYIFILKNRTSWHLFAGEGGLHLPPMEVPRLGVELELHPLAYTTAMPDPSRLCDLHHSSQQHGIPNPVS